MDTFLLVILSVFAAIGVIAIAVFIFVYRLAKRVQETTSEQWKKERDEKVKK